MGESVLSYSCWSHAAWPNHADGTAVPNVAEGTRGKRHDGDGAASPTRDPPLSVAVCSPGSGLCFSFNLTSLFLSPSSRQHHQCSPSVPSSHLLSLCFPQWCERNQLCRRLQLRDLLVAPLQRLTRYPLLLRNMAKRCQREDESKGLQTVAERVDTSICELTTPEPTRVIRSGGDIGRKRDTDSLCQGVTAQLMCDFSIQSLRTS